MKIEFPWHSDMMLKHPWFMQIFLVVLALMFSIITWVKKK